MSKKSERRTFTFTCPTCGKGGYASVGKVQRHVQRKHPGKEELRFGRNTPQQGKKPASEKQ